MHPLKLIETSPGKYSLLLDAGTTEVDGLVEDLGHEPNGYFWEGVASYLVATTSPTLNGRFSFDSEGGMFCAYGTDQAALEALGSLMTSVTASPDRIRALIASATDAGFDFDD
jgi:hypothetical protein